MIKLLTIEEIKNKLQDNEETDINILKENNDIPEIKYFDSDKRLIKRLYSVKSDNPFREFDIYIELLEYKLVAKGKVRLHKHYVSKLGDKKYNIEYGYYILTYDWGLSSDKNIFEDRIMVFKQTKEYYKNNSIVIKQENDLKIDHELFIRKFIITNDIEIFNTNKPVKATCILTFNDSLDILNHVINITPSTEYKNNLSHYYNKSFKEGEIIYRCEDDYFKNIEIFTKNYSYLFDSYTSGFVNNEIIKPEQIASINLLNNYLINRDKILKD